MNGGGKEMRLGGGEKTAYGWCVQRSNHEGRDKQQRLTICPEIAPILSRMTGPSLFQMPDD